MTDRLKRRLLIALVSVVGISLPWLIGLLVASRNMLSYGYSSLGEAALSTIWWAWPFFILAVLAGRPKVPLSAIWGGFIGGSIATVLGFLVAWQSELLMILAIFVPFPTLLCIYLGYLMGKMPAKL